MANTRINQIAKEAKVSNKEVIAKLAELGIEVEDEKAEIDEEDAQLVLDLLKEENQKYNEYDDCGCLLYDVTQNVYQGGSGPVCNALVSFGYIYQMILKGKYKRVLVLLLNPVMTNQKLSIPCVCHGYVLEGVS